MKRFFNELRNVVVEEGNISLNVYSVKAKAESDFVIVPTEPEASGHGEINLVIGENVIGITYNDPEEKVVISINGKEVENFKNGYQFFEALYDVIDVSIDGEIKISTLANDRFMIVINPFEDNYPDDYPIIELTLLDNKLECQFGYYQPRIVDLCKSFSV